MGLQLSDLIWISDKRKNLLMLLLDGPKSMDHIVKALNSTAHAMSPQVKILKEEMLIEQHGNMYGLTDIGRIIVTNMYPLFNTLQVIDEDRKYWCERDLSFIPQAFLERIGELGNYMLIDPGINNLFDLPAEFTENLKRSQHIDCFVSYYHPTYLNLYFDQAAAGREMTFIFTNSVFARVTAEWRSCLDKIKDKESVRICLYRDDGRPGLPSMCITESFAYLFLFRRDNNYETRRLLGFDESARKWSADLFAHYLSLSSPIDPGSV